MRDYIERQDPCPYCGCNAFVYRENGPHVEVRCSFCDSHLGFAPQINETRWKQMIKERAMHTCERCGRQLTSRKLDAHHMIPVWFMPDRKLELSNGICLCKECHRQLHGIDGSIKEKQALKEEE